MNIKALVGIVVLLIIVGGGWWYVSSNPMSAGPAAEEHALVGTVQENRDYKYSESTDVYEIEANWPSEVPLGNAAASAKARLTIEKALKERIDEFKANGQFDTMTAEDREIQGLDGTRKYALSMEYQDYDAPGYHSYIYAIYEDTLGAHPNGYFMTFVFDTEGNVVSLGDLLATNPNWLEELSLEVSNSVAAQLKEHLGDSLPVGDEGPDVTGAMYPEGVSAKEENFQNWVLDGEMLVIAIPPYQVAAYAAGSFEVRVPLAGLQ